MPTSTVSSSATSTSPPSMNTSGSSASPSNILMPFSPGCSLKVAFTSLDSICRMGKNGRATTTQPPGTANAGSRMKKRFMRGGKSNSRRRLPTPDTRFSTCRLFRPYFSTISLPRAISNSSRLESSPCWVISVRRSFMCTTVAPRERSRFEKTRCCAFRSTRLKHSSTFIVSSVQGITESTSRPGSCTSTSSSRPTSLWTLQADLRAMALLCA
mmetsp:Transcript_7427/g.20061  ORF Transcript_7427/g.20061 Transcript_7427/m.20061 type:complete len:213 (-) Transcript_7427:1082-1720(-)